jgi:ribonuclease VapC
MMFVDASAIIAIMTQEEGFEQLVARLGAAPRKLTSPLALWESAVRLMSKTSFSDVEVKVQLGAFLKIAEIETVQVGGREGDLAIDAYARYGKRRHIADLNFGDCFAYACAKANDVELLYVGNDFGHTDVNAAFA